MKNYSIFYAREGNIFSCIIHIVFKKKIHQIISRITHDYKTLCMADKTTYSQEVSLHNSGSETKQKVSSVLNQSLLSLYDYCKIKSHFPFSYISQSLIYLSKIVPSHRLLAVKETLVCFDLPFEARLLYTVPKTPPQWLTTA